MISTVSGLPSVKRSGGSSARSLQATCGNRWEQFNEPPNLRCTRRRRVARAPLTGAGERYR